MPPPKGTPQIYAWTLYFQELESLAYIFVADSMDLSSFSGISFSLQTPVDILVLYFSLRLTASSADAEKFLRIFPKFSLTSYLSSP